MAFGTLLSLSLICLSYTIPAFASSVWTVNCAPLTIQRSDPLISPGVASGHVHAIVGGTAFRRDMDEKLDATNAKATTCDKFTDHSNYWCPQLYEQSTNGSFSMVPFLGGNFYYKNYTCDYNPSGGCATPSQARAFPEGFRMIAGDTFRRTYNASDQSNEAILFTSGSQYNVHEIPTSKGGYLQGAVRFPSCWNGVDLNPADHKSHVAYPDPKLGGNTEGGMCPKSHPYALISVGAEFGFDLTSVKDMTRLVFANGDTTGYGFHADFVNGWKDLGALQNSFSNCFDNGACPWRSFGTPDGQEYSKHVMSPETPAVYEEDIGLRGSIAKLPGINSVYVKP